MNIKNNMVKKIIFSLFFSISLIQSTLALDPNVQELVTYETRANAAATRSDTQVNIEHYEIPLSLVGADLAQRMPNEIKKALIFQRNGVDYVRWVINPEDTLWHLEVKRFLESRGLSSEKKSHLLGSMTASRSYIIEDPTSGAQFSIKVSTNKTGGHWKDKKQPIQDAKDIRVIADYVHQEQQMKPFEHLITMDEPGIFMLETLDQAMVIRTLDGLAGTTKRYLPGFSALHKEMGVKIAMLNGSSNPEEFWRKNYNEPLAKALAELAVRTGLTYDSPHSQNFLIELDEMYRPTGKIVIRDFGDSYLCKEHFIAKGRADIPENWTQKNVKTGKIKISVGVIHGNKFPNWMNETHYQQWGKQYFEIYKQEFSRLSGIPTSELITEIQMSKRYFVGSYKISGQHWEQFLSGLPRHITLNWTSSCRSIFN